jgi:hypothetical protein
MQEQLHTRCSWRNLRERDHLEDLCIHDKIILKWLFKKYDVGGGVWPGFIWLRIGKDGCTVVNVIMNLWVP